MKVIIECSECDSKAEIEVDFSKLPLDRGYGSYVCLDYYNNNEMTLKLYQTYKNKIIKIKTDIFNKYKKEHEKISKRKNGKLEDFRNTILFIPKFLKKEKHIEIERNLIILHVLLSDLDKIKKRLIK